MPDQPGPPIEPLNEQETATPKQPMRGRARALVVLAVTILGIYVYLLVLPFVPALAWALVLALLFLPAHQWIEGRVRNRNLAAAASVLPLGVIVVIPGLFLASRLLQEAAKAHSRSTPSSPLANGSAPLKHFPTAPLQPNG